MTTDLKEIEIHIPYNFDSKKILELEGWKPYMIERHHQKLDFMVHQVIYNGYINSKYEKGDFISLSREKHFERFIYKRELAKLKPLLVKHGVWEIYDPYNEVHQTSNRGGTGTYVVASEDTDWQGECMGYRLMPQYQVRNVVVSVDRYTNLYNNIIKCRKQDGENLTGICKWIWFHLKDISIKKEEAIDFINNWRIEVKTDHTLLNLEAKHEDKNVDDIIEYRYNRYLSAITAIAEGTTFLPIRDKTGRRVHTPLTVLLKGLRQFLFLKHKPTLQLMNSDISNSQPFCLIALFPSHWPNGNLPADALEYIRLTSTSGTFYKHMIEKLNVPENLHSTFKKTLFAKVFYSETHRTFDTKEAIAFREEFPNVYELIIQEKRQSYKRLAVLMQRVESDAMIDGVMKELMHKYKDRHFFTSIHDSIVFEAGFEEEVNALIIKHMLRVVGYEPYIKPAESFNIIPNNMQVEPAIESSSTTIIKKLPIENTEYKEFKILTTEELWELQEAEEWGDANAAIILKLIKTDSELDFTEDGLPFYHKTYKIEKRYWKQVG